MEVAALLEALDDAAVILDGRPAFVAVNRPFADALLDQGTSPRELIHRPVLSCRHELDESLTRHLRQVRPDLVLDLHGVFLFRPGATDPVEMDLRVRPIAGHPIEPLPVVTYKPRYGIPVHVTPR